MKANILVLFCLIACLGLVSAVSGTLEVDFSADTVSGEVPLTVTFSGVSENATSWEWDFGDEESSSEQNPTHTYAEVGTYSVKLNVSNDNETGDYTEPNYITVQEAKIYPTVAFTASATSGSVPFEVTFNDTSVNSDTVLWDFGDGESSTDHNITHEFTSVDSFTVNLTATNENGSVSTTETISVTNPLAASFSSSPDSGVVPLLVNFTDGSTPTAFIDTYSWNFGDGSSLSSEQNPTHNFTTAGTYAISLTVTNDTYSISHSSSGTIVVNSLVTEVPVAEFSANVTSGSPPLAVLFTDSSTNATSWSWEVVGYTSGQSSQNFTYIFDETGTYTITLIASKGSLSDSETKTNYTQT